MGFPLILLLTVPFRLALTTAQNSEEVYILKDTARSQLTCMSGDDDAALVWNFDLDMNEPSERFKKFKPEKPTNENIPHCAVWRSMQCFALWSTSGKWATVNSLEKPMGPVVDYRWEGFKELKNGDWTRYPTLCSSRENEVTVVFSVRGTKDIEVRLCDPGISRCFLIRIAVNGRRSAIQYCRRNTHYSRQRNEICQDLNVLEHETAIVDAYEWRTYRLEWINNAQVIRVYSDIGKNAFLEGKSLNKWHRMCRIGIQSAAEARIKLHDYNYTLTTSQFNNLTTKPFSWNSKFSCINMLVSLCPKCRMNVSLVSIGSGEEFANGHIQGDESFGSKKLHIWRSIKLNMTLRSSASNKVELRITPRVNGYDVSNIWWAVDYSRVCEQNSGVRESTISSPYPNQTQDALHTKCQKLFYRKTVSVDSSKSIRSTCVNQVKECIQQRNRSCFLGSETSSRVGCNSAHSTSNQGSEIRTEDEKNSSMCDQALVSTSRRPNCRKLSRISKRAIGKTCLKIVPRRTNLTLEQSSNSANCQSFTSVDIDVYDETKKSLGHQFCEVFPCDYAVEMQPFTKYDVLVRSQSDVLLNETVTTLESAPGSVKGLHLPFISAHNVTVEWKPPARTNGIIRNYTVSIQRLKLLGCETLRKPSPPETPIYETVTETTVSFLDLHPYAEYKLTVTANTVEPGPSTSYTFETEQLDIPTSKFSNLRLFNESWLEWEPPEDCSTITGSTSHTKLIFRNLSVSSQNPIFDDQTVYSTYNLRNPRLELLPYTKYEVRVYVIRFHFKPYNGSAYRVLEWETAATAPPPVTNVSIYDVDAANNTMSVRWKSPDPPNGKIESYTVLVVSKNKEIQRWLIEVSELKKCTMFHVCFESVSVPMDILTNVDLELQVYAKNTNVSEDGAKEIVPFKLDDLYNTAPSPPKNLTTELLPQGIVKVQWEQSSLSPTKILRFRIEVDCLQTNLVKKSCSNDLTTHYIEKRTENIYFAQDMELLTSTEYRVSVMAVNHRNRTSSSIMTHFLTSEGVSFVSDDEMRVHSENASVILQVPAVVNATKNTRVVIEVEGISSCKSKSSKGLPSSTIQTESLEKWIAAEYNVNSSDPMNFTFNLNQYYGVEQNCSFQRQETYVFVVALKYRGRSSSLRSSLFTFTDKKSLPEQNQIWLVIFPILVIVALFFIIFIWYRKKKKSWIQPSHSCDLPLVRTVDTSSTSPCTSKRLSALCDVTEPRVSPQKNEPDLVPYDPHSYRVKVDEFEEYAKSALATKLLDSQYEAFSTGLIKPCEYGTLPENMLKNRFKNIVPYDDNRVILEKIEGDSYSDYINASYIQGFRKAKAYIATQGPIRNQKKMIDTVPDFWRMVWQEKSLVICMLANVMENKKKKCEQYWPEIGESITYGEIEISNIEHEVFADYTIRTLDVRCNMTKRKVKHFHYTGWPDHGVPTYTQSLVTYLKKLLATPAGKGPIVVHCSAGVGRTGTIILCDICLRQAVKDRVIDVPGTAERMRQDRVNMVQSTQQYLLAHLVIMESMTPEQTLIHCDRQLDQKIAELRKQLPFNVKRLEEIVWQDRTLHKLITRTDPAEAIQNRISEFDQDAPHSTQDALPPSPKDQHSFINTVNVDGYKGKEQYLATELPSPSTLPDFWRLIAERRIELIVILQRPDPNNLMQCDIKPDEPTIVPFPHIKIEVKSTSEDMEYFTMEKLLVTDTSGDEERLQPLTIVTCTGWERKVNGTPPPPTGLVSLWIASEKIQRKESPTLVVCHDGVTGCGLYLALSFLLEWMAVERECDVISAVRAIRRSKPEFVKTLQQFEYLYDAAMNYNTHFETYANFS